MPPNIDVESLRKRVGFPRFVNVHEAAALVHTPVKTVRFWLESGRLAHSKPGRRVLIRVDDLEAFVAGRAQPSREEHAS